jgi:hypothetical protein
MWMLVGFQCRIAEALSNCQSSCPKSSTLASRRCLKLSYNRNNLSVGTEFLPGLSLDQNKRPPDQQMVVSHWRSHLKSLSICAKLGGGPERIPVWKKLNCKWKVMSVSFYRRCQISTVYKSRAVHSSSFFFTPNFPNVSFCHRQPAHRCRL